MRHKVELFVTRISRTRYRTGEDLILENSGTSVDEDGEDVDVLQRPDIDLRRLIQEKVFLGSNTVVLI